jgi:hypothetical protein
VLRLLLTDRSEKEIAERLGIGWRTTHDYTVSILRKFGVRGRVGLMASWLRYSRPRGRQQCRTPLVSGIVDITAPRYDWELT